MANNLCPAQLRAFDSLINTLAIGNVFVLYGGVGSGKSTVLREVHSKTGGVFLNMKDLIDAMRHQHPLALEENFERMIMKALVSHEIVILDDFHLLNNVICCYGGYPRTGFLNAPLTTICLYASEAQKKLIFGSNSRIPGPLDQRAFNTSISEFSSADYEFLCRHYLSPEGAGKLDYEKVYRFAPKLNAHQLKGACLWIRQGQDTDTANFIEYLRTQHLVSNVDLGEVQAVDLHDLKGVDDVIQSLEANIILPLENDELAAELNLKPKRGVLLAGPPGTGKTTIGRALAHRLKSKFFLIDGTFISGMGDFYIRVHQIFETAKQNAPSIIFIDDSDVIFESGEEMGLYRYLLTMLDGLESQSAGRVCVMMTAMDVGNLPPAMVRSGRIELWLEMQLPNEEARAAIVSEHVGQLPVALAHIDLPQIVSATEGFTGADLKRLIEDGKMLYAYDKAQGRDLRTPTGYMLSAVETVRNNKQRYLEAEARARLQRPSRPPWFGAVAVDFSAGV
ncbi:MAG: AAA family ATPase, partial [Acidobacteria bacterium]|nr:AAA family ATPase [Acidobacteriota bacterium]